MLSLHTAGNISVLTRALALLTLSYPAHSFLPYSLLPTLLTPYRSIAHKILLTTQSLPHSRPLPQLAPRGTLAVHKDTYSVYLGGKPRHKEECGIEEYQR